MNDLILLIGLGTMLIFTAIWIVKRVEKDLKGIEKLVRRSIELGFWNLKGIRKVRKR